MHRGWRCWTLCGVVMATVAVLPAAAEVAVRTDRNGTYLGTQVTVNHGGVMEVWSRSIRSRSLHTLNPFGDRKGDLWPTVVEANQYPHHPWVVWSRYNGTDYDLVWSRWADGAWTSEEWIGAHGAQTRGHDLDPDLRFGDDGLPYVAWWRDEDGLGRVYLSVFLGGRWSEPFAVTPTGHDARHPVIRTATAEGVVEIDYKQGEDTISQALMLNGPGTITDDINPQVLFSFKGMSGGGNLYDGKRKR